MKKIWVAILRFFGFGDEIQTPGEKAKEMMAWITSQDRMDQCTQQAFQAVQKKEPLPPNERPHPYEATIKADCIKVDAALTEFHAGELSEKFGDVQYLINLIKDGISTALSSASPRNIEMAVTGKIAQSKPEAEKLKSDLDRAKDELRIFRGANALTRDALHVDKDNALYVIGAFAFFEAVANMLFLRENISTAIAIFIAMAVAAINVLANVWFGIQYREKNHFDVARAKKGRIYFFYALLMIVFLNSFIAGYRLLEHYTDSHGITAAFMLESTVLLIVGIALGTAAFNKGYALDDPYPEYGDLAKKVAELENNWSELRKLHANFCEEIKQAAIGAHKNTKEKITRSQNQLATSLPEMARMVELWSADRRQLNHVYGELQQMFKTTMVANHPDGHSYTQNISKLDENQQLTHYTKQIKELISNREESQKIIDDLLTSIDQSEAILTNWITGESAKVLWEWPN